MRRLIAFLGHSNQAKGVIIEDNIETLSDLNQQLSDIFQITTNMKIFWKNHLHNIKVEITDPRFLRDGDSIIIFTDESQCDNEFIEFNVGGQIFLTTKMTIEHSAPESMLARMISSQSVGMNPGYRDKNGALIIDRSPRYFEPILNYLRTGKLILDESINPEGVYEEAKYYGISNLFNHLEEIISKKQDNPNQTPLNRKDVIRLITSTQFNKVLRFQGINFENADLSRLDLRNINFKYAKMKGCNLMGANLSFCDMERADLSKAILDGAQMLGVKLNCATLESASLRGCNFDDPKLSVAVMEGANLRSIVLEGSNMAGIDLRVASIKHGNLKNCDLRGAVLAGADLEFCDLSGSDLFDANLRGANLKDTTLELMQTPLHMSQTIR